MHQSSRPFVVARPFDAAALLAGATARQAMTPTALAQARLAARASLRGSLASGDGAFASDVARAFIGWKDR